MDSGIDSNIRGPDSSKRRELRLPWHVPNASVESFEQSLSMFRQSCDITDIGAQGLAVRVASFIHTDTRLRVSIPMPEGASVTLAGTVRWCDYTDGYHECGIMFDNPVQLERIVPRLLWTHEMLVDELSSTKVDVVHIYGSSFDESLVRVALRETPMRVTSVGTLGEARKELASADASVLYVDVRASEIDLTVLRDVLLDTCFVGALIMIGDTEDDITSGICALGDPAAKIVGDDGMAKFLGFTAEVLADWTATMNAEDLVSSLPPDRELEKMVSSYLEACRSAAEAIRPMVASEDVKGITTMLRRISGTARPLGFGTLAKLASSASEKLTETGDVNAARVELSRVRGMLLALKGTKRRSDDQAA